jgi:maltose alpha-D-glucosyltransferase/alpha-amylase
MAIGQEDRHPIVEIMQQTPDIPDTCQWVIFLRNHDELTLEMVTDRERDYMYQMYADEPRARLNLGIRRRLAPLMGNDLDKIKLMNSLLLSMPGSPVIYYGDEIGMGDNIYLGDRNGVRTPMQWSPDRNAGFSKADPQRLYLPPIMDPVYGYEVVNVEAQSRQQSSLLNWMRRILAVRKGHKALGRGALVFLKPANRKVLAYLRQYQDDVIMCVANLARAAQAVELDLSAFEGRVPVELMGRTAFPPIGKLPYLLTLPGHSFYWFSLAVGEDAPDGYKEAVPYGELPVLVLFDGWRSFFREQVVPWRIALAEKMRAQLETEILPGFLASQRWYAAKSEPIRRAALLDTAEWEAGGKRWLMALLQVSSADGLATPYFLPLALAWEDGDEEAARAHAIAKVRQQARVGVLADAFADEAFCRALVQEMGAGSQLACTHGIIRFSPTRVFAELAGENLNDLPVRAPSVQGSNTTVALGSSLFLKGYRRLQAGIGPEVEVGRFLTEVARFPNAVQVAGVVEYQGKSDAAPMALALLQGYVENQGDGWHYTLAYLERFLDECRIDPSLRRPPAEAHAAYLSLIRILGQRTGELHKALALPSGDPAFDPEPVTDDELALWVERAHQEAEATLALIERQREMLDQTTRAEADSLLNKREAIAQYFRTAVPSHLEALKTRYHGDYHLGQVLLKQNDFILIDFEGEPARPIAERRQKHSPLRDVAGMLRSFNYAAFSALAQVGVAQPVDTTAIEPFARQWEAETQRVFVETYRDTVRGSRLYPDWNEARSLLDLFLLEKACYELRYELGNRPDWVHVPLRGILELLAQGE